MAARVIVGIDPGDETGIALADAEAKRLTLVATELVHMKRAGFSQARAIRILDELIGPSEWAVAIEKPPSPKFGIRAAPTHGERFWRDVVDLLARERAARAGGGRFFKPVVLRPMPQEWRAPLGLPTKGVGKNHLDRREYLKQAAITRMERLFGFRLPVPDIADAASIAEWATRVIPHDALVQRFSSLTGMRWAA